MDTVDDSLDSFEDTPRFLALRNQKLRQKKLGVLYPRLPNTKGEVWYLDPQKPTRSLTSGSMMFHVSFRGVLPLFFSHFFQVPEISWSWLFQLDYSISLHEKIAFRYFHPLKLSWL